MNKSIHWALILSLGILVWTMPAAAELAGPSSGFSNFLGLSLGAKGAFGGNYVSEPGDSVIFAWTDSELPFRSGAGGWGGGGGLYTEFRVLWGYLGLEFDLLFDHSKNWCGIDFAAGQSTVNTEWIFTYTALRMPILLEGNLETDKARVSLGIGPEFSAGLTSGSDVQVTNNDDLNDSAEMDDTRSRFHAKKQTDTYLCVSLGLAIKVWRLAITADLRYSYNFTQPKEYDNRVTYEGEGDDAEITTVASNTMDGRLMIGVAYEFGFK